MAVKRPTPQVDQVQSLLDNFQSKLSALPPDARVGLEQDLEEIRSSMIHLVREQGKEGASAPQAAVPASTSRYRDLGESLSSPLAIFGPDLRLFYRNPAAARASSIPNEQAIGLTFEELHPDLTGTDLHDAFHRAISTRQTQTCLNRWPSPDGAGDRYYEVKFYPGQDWIVAISDDVTERVNAVEALRQSEMFNRQLIESSIDCIKVLDLDGILLSINNGGLRLLEIDQASAVTGRDWLTFWPEDAHPHVQAALDAARSGQVGIFRGISPSFKGKPLWWDVIISPICGAGGTVERLLVISRDITGRVQAEQALKQSEELARQQLDEIEAIYANAPIGLCVFDDQLRWQRLNQRIAEINGVPLEDHIGKTPREVVPDVGEQAEAALKHILETGQPLLDFEMVGTTAAHPGVTRYWNERWTPIKDKDGRVTGISVAAEEITERKRAEAELHRASKNLRESEGRFRAMADGTPIMIWMHNPDGSIEFVNRAWTEFFGVTLEQVKSAGWTPLIHTDDYDGYVGEFIRCTQERKPFRAQTRVMLPVGEWRVLDSHGQPRSSETGEFLGMVGSSIDITEQVQAEAALRKSEEKFARAFHSSPVAMAITSLATGQYIDVNESVCRQLGYTREEMLAKTTLDLGVYQTEAERNEFIQLLSTQGRIHDHERTLFNKAGEPITALLSFEPIEVDEQACILATMMDVTDRKRAEAEREQLLAEMERQKNLLMRLIDLSPLGISVLNGPEHRVILANPAEQKLFPTKPAFTGRTVAEIWPEGADVFLPTLDHVYQTGESFHMEDALWMTDKGNGPEEAYYTFSYTPLYGPEGVIEGILTLAQETTEQVKARRRIEEELEERRQVQLALLESEEKFRSAFESASVGFAMTDLSNHFIDANPAYFALTGYSLEELQDRAFLELVHPDDKAQNQLMNDRLLAGLIGDYVIENRYIRKDGHVVWVKKSISLVRTPEGDPIWYIALVENITERKQAEAALEQAHIDLMKERNRLMAVMEALPVGLAIYDEKGGVVQANPGFEGVWGNPRPPANSVEDYDLYKAWWVETGERVQAEEWAAARAVQNGETTIGQYLRIQRFDGSMGYVMNSGAPVRDAHGKIIGGVVAIMDITGQVEIEQALRESQDRFRVALASVPLLVYTCDRNLRYTWVYNPLNGFQVEDVLGKRDDEVLPAEAAVELIAAKQQALETGQGAMREIKMSLHGEDRYYILTTDPIHGERGEVTGLTCSAMDITEQKRLEIEREETEMRIEVQRRLMDQREKERQGIARDIHDGPIQTLASTAFNLQFLKESFPDPTLTVELNQISLNVKAAIRELREVVNDLRPPSIIRFGLTRAILMHAEDLRERYPETDLELELDEENVRLSDQACLTVFRVFQEGMNNIFHHAGASKVWVKYQIEPEQFTLEMRDNGGGFSVPRDFGHLTSSGHFGLAGMKERVESVGGTFTITSQPGQGTVIRIHGPLLGKNIK